MRDVQRCVQNAAQLMKHIFDPVIDGCMHRNAGWLVDDQEIIVLVHDRAVPIDLLHRKALRPEMDAKVLPAGDRAIGANAFSLLVNRAEMKEARPAFPGYSKPSRETLQQSRFGGHTVMADPSLRGCRGVV